MKKGELDKICNIFIEGGKKCCNSLIPNCFSMKCHTLNSHPHSLQFHPSIYKFLSEHVIGVS